MQVKEEHKSQDPTFNPINQKKKKKEKKTQRTNSKQKSNTHV